MPGRLLFASTNEGKIVEAKAILASLKCDVLSLSELPLLTIKPVAETGSTFEANALLKAQAYAMQANLPTLAEDSGLTVDSLEGFPGVKSARWLSGNDHDRCLALLNKMEGITERSASFICSACLFNPTSGQNVCYTGRVEGVIAPYPVGSAGFGYDPIFIPSGFDQTFAQLGGEVKNKHSHRRKAFEQIFKFLNTNPSFFDL